MIFEYLKIYEKGLEIKTIRNYGGKTKSSSYLNNAISVPDKPEVSITNACSVVLSGKGGIDNVVNNAGAYALFSVLYVPVTQLDLLSRYVFGPRAMATIGGSNDCSC